MFDWKRKKVLVTGAGGFIGSHLTERLVKLGVSVKAFVRYNSRNDWGLIEFLPREVQESLEIFSGDLKDPEAVRKAVKGREIVFHLGALIAIPYSYINPLDFVQTNIGGTANILNACREYGVEKIVHTSTSEVYGTARYTPIDEDHPLQGQSPYSASKIGADKLAESYYLSFNLPVAILRPFNTYGLRQSARAVIPTIITQALLNERIKLGSLEPTRDLTYISDTVEGFIKEVESKNSTGQVINLGTGEETSIGDLVKKVGDIIGKELKIEHDSARVRPERSEVGRLISNNTKAKRILDWKPKVSLEEGLKKTIDWISKNLERYKIEKYNI
jgi:NAD dependent epimerase/dehydratase